MARILEGIFAYADGDALCRYSEKLSDKEKTSLKALGLGRYIDLTDLDAKRGFLYRDLGGVYLDGSSGEPEHDYSFLCYASRKTAEGHVLEVHTLRESVEKDVSFTRGSKEMDHFLVFDDLPSLSPGDVLTSGPLIQNNDLPKWKLGQKDKAELPTVKEGDFRAKPLVFPKEKERFLAFAEAFFLARQEGKSLVCLYPLSEDDAFHRFLFDWLKLFPPRVAFDISFLSAARRDDGSMILGCPYLGSRDEALLSKAFPNSRAVDFAALPVSKPTTAASRILEGALLDPDSLKGYVALLTKIGPSMDGLDDFVAFAEASFLAEEIQEPEDVLSLANAQEKLLDALLRYAKPLGRYATQETKKRVYAALKTINVGLRNDYGVLREASRERLIDKAIALYGDLVDASTRLAVLRHLDDLLLPKETAWDYAPYAEGLLHALDVAKDFATSTYYPHLYLDASLGKRALALCEKSPATRFVGSYVSFLASRLPASRTTLLRYADLLAQGGGPKSAVAAILKSEETSEENRLSLCLDLSAGLDEAKAAMAIDGLFEAYPDDDGLKRLIESLRNVPASKCRDEAIEEAISRYVLAIDAPDLAGIKQQLDRLSEVGEDGFGTKAESALVARFDDDALFDEAEEMDDEQFAAYGKSALRQGAALAKKLGKDDLADRLSKAYDLLEDECADASLAGKRVGALERRRLAFACKGLRTLPRKQSVALLKRFLGKKKFRALVRQVPGEMDERYDAIITMIEDGTIPLSELDSWWEFGHAVDQAKAKKPFNFANVAFAFRDLTLSLLVGLGAFLASFGAGLCCYAFLANNTYYLLFLLVAIVTGVCGYAITRANCRESKSRFLIVLHASLESLAVGVVILAAFMGVFLFLP